MWQEQGCQQCQNNRLNMVCPEEKQENANHQYFPENTQLAFALLLEAGRESTPEQHQRSPGQQNQDNRNRPFENAIDLVKPIVPMNDTERNAPVRPECPIWQQAEQVDTPSTAFGCDGIANHAH